MSSSNDLDLWKFTSPDFASPTLLVHVDALGQNNPIVDAYVLNERGDRMAARVSRKADGGRTLTITNPGVNRNYFLYVKVANNSVKVSGNYLATIDFATDPPTELQTAYTGS